MLLEKSKKDDDDDRRFPEKSYADDGSSLEESVSDDRSSLESAINMLNPLKTDIERLLASKNILKRKPGYELFTQL